MLVFECITLEGWTDMMYTMRAARGLANDAYFVFVVMFGSLFMLNLVVAVLVANFETGRETEETGKPLS